MVNALKLLKEGESKNPVSGIFLLSDGLDNGPKDSIKDLLDQYSINRTYSIHTFGYGKDHDPVLMTNIADMGDGNFYFIDKLDILDDCFVDCLGGLLFSFGENAVIKLALTPFSRERGIKISKVYGGDKIWKAEGDFLTTKLSNVVMGTEKDYVFDLRVPPLDERELSEEYLVFARATLTLTLFDQTEVVLSAELKFKILKHMQKKDWKYEKRVVLHRFRAQFGDVLSQAQQIADKGNYSKSKQILEKFLSKLEESRYCEEELMKNMIQDTKKAIDNIEPQIYLESGKTEIIGNSRAQTQQRSYNKSSNTYSSCGAVDMLQSHQSKKSNSIMST